MQNTSSKMSAPPKYCGGFKIFIFFKLISVNLVDNYITSYSPTEILENINTSCFVLLNHKSDLQLQLHMDQLASVYIDDSHVTVGMIQADNFIWPNGDQLRLKGATNELYSSKENDILIFDKQKVDRTCLVEKKFPWNPFPRIYLGMNDLNSMVDFINSKCMAYRRVDGKLNAQGLHRESIQASFFTVQTVSNITMGQLRNNSTSCQNLENSCRNYYTPCDSEENKMYDAKFSQISSDIYKKPTHFVSSAMAQCDRINMTINRDTFFHSYLKTSKPFVIEKGTTQWPAFKKWSNEYLMERYGSNKVHVKLTPGGDFEGVEKAELWENYKSFNIPHYVKKQLLYPDLVVVRPTGIDMKFSDFVTLITLAAEQSQRNVSAYLEYSSIPTYMPELEEDVEEPLFANFLKRAHLNMWLSDGHTLGRLHFDPFDNFLCQIRGTKQVVMFEPHDNAKLYEAHIPQATLSYNRSSKAFRRVTLEDSTSMVMSPVDIMHPDFQRFPKFADAIPLNCTINEGDILFMPAFWWHEVYSWPNTTEKRNLAVNFWYEPFLQKEYPCPECKLDINPLYQDLL